MQCFEMHIPTSWVRRYIIRTEKKIMVMIMVIERILFLNRMNPI